MIKIDEEYRIESDYGNSFVLINRKRRIHALTKELGKKTDITIGYYSSIERVLNGYIQEKMHEKANETVDYDLKEIVRYINSLKEMFTELLGTKL